MISYVTVVAVFIWIIGYITIALASPWAYPSLEALDELNDAQIYSAVVSSISDWKKKQEQKGISNRSKREDTLSACYPDLGCFEASGPFGYLDTLPSKPDEINTKFWLYPGRSRRRSGSPPAEVPFEKLEDAFSWAKQGFNSSLPTKVLIHGFGSDCSYIWVYEIRSALMAVEEVNIICVDWSNGASLPNYVKASANTRLVGKQLSLLLSGLVERNGLSLRDTHLIGFSLGAHIAGFAGADLGNLSRITGLDPAGPLFESQDPRARLDQSDAAFVDVIHSNGENLILGGLGSSQPMGHVDFYPNGGRMQKGCSHLFVGAVSDIIWSSAVEGRSLCNHRRAYKFFIDSVSPRCHFPAFPCDTYENFLAGKCFPCTEERKCGNMGYYADRSKGRGQLFLITRDEEPFCAHQYHVKIESIAGHVPIKSYGKIQITLIGESFLNETFMMTRKEDEEMKLGESISRILVPHPILAQPTRIQILYTAYSGWLSSGLTQWRMDKVTLMDSFGKMSSVCKKRLILESGIPVMLPLYPGECNLPNESSEVAEDRIQNSGENMSIDSNDSDDSPDFIPTQVVRIGLEDANNNSNILKNAIDIFNIPWENEKENDLVDNEALESSRALNTRIVKAGNSDKGDSDGLVKEIVEPILKPHSNKIARSHDPDKDKAEISEPILGPTTAKNVNVIQKERRDKEMKHTFYNEKDWTPKDIPITAKYEEKQKSLEPKVLVAGHPDNPIEVLTTTVQFLPQRLARMFEQAEKYARETILPLVSTYTPRFISDIITPQDNQPKYVPLSYEEPTTKVISSSAIEETFQERNLLSKSFDSLPKIQDKTLSVASTPETHIQKIKKKGVRDKDDLDVAATGYSSRNTAIPVVSSKSLTSTSSTISPKKEIRSAKKDDNVPTKRVQDPLTALLTNVQIIPENIGKMFQEAERFTRHTVLPFVSSLTPKFITNIFIPKEKPKYIPFTSEETTSKTKIKLSDGARNKRNQNFDPPPLINLPLHESTTYSNIQKIARRKIAKKHN